jgi:hypothetical protein
MSEPPVGRVFADNNDPGIAAVETMKTNIALLSHSAGGFAGSKSNRNKEGKEHKGFHRGQILANIKFIHDICVTYMVA